VKTTLEEFRALTDADELIVVHQADSVPRRLRSIELVAEAAELTARSRASG
jgi:hypothetical protein